MTTPVSVVILCSDVPIDHSEGAAVVSQETKGVYAARDGGIAAPGELDLTGTRTWGTRGGVSTGNHTSVEADCVPKREGERGGRQNIAKHK